MSQPISGTIAEAYLRRRGITALHASGALRFHPRCYYRPDADAPTETWPALIAAVTDLDGRITGAHRTWLDPSGRDKAPIDTPRRAMGHLLGHGVRFGVAHDVMAAGEGIETMLSLRSIMPTCRWSPRSRPITSPPSCSRQHCAVSMSPAMPIRPATRRWRRLNDRAAAAGIEALTLSPALGDFNEDLLRLGTDELRAALRVQLAPEDVVRFMDWATAATG